MIIQALLAASAVAAASLVGALLFGHDRRLVGLERFVIPVAVGVFLSLILVELIPETLHEAPTYGPLVIAAGFLGFYILANSLHKKFHQHGGEDCHKKSAASMVLIGDAIHNLADGFVLGGAFLVDPAVGFAVMTGIILHEVPQEIVEFGVLIRAGYTRMQAALYNLISASTVILGTLIILLISEHVGEFTWVLTAFAAGSLLYIALSELLPKIHESLPHYQGIWQSTWSIALGFVLMTVLITWAHENTPHTDEHHEDELHDEHADAGAYCEPQFDLSV